MLSLDIECSGKGVLFSIGLYSDDHAVVIKVGEAQQHDDIIWVKDELERKMNTICIHMTGIL